ncbi:hypothetical protein REC12_20050 [Desulfosporosinus sp. PR]|uniref:hypothetical protein n=1 Tax=Candidatus Desulfosporosinus nitrosoreducens TaxID=3401928 RepID=UPI0027FD3016|nr:hypothetical protein [Desulfosporosinus sp. PR]MDQ7095891.1 hypothetical protein [Desulfosporosinus sp. PR]
MNIKKLFAGVGILAGVVILSLTLMNGNAYSNNKYSEKEYTVRDSAIKNFDLDTQKAQVLFAEDIFDNTKTEINDTKSKLAVATFMLNDEKISVVGDYLPVYFLEGNKVSIAIKHANGTVSLTQFDISKEKPVQIGHIVKEAK